VRHILVSAAVFVLLAAVMPGTAVAHTFVADTSLTIHKAPTGATASGATVVIYGRLLSPRLKCRFDQVVKLLRVRPGRDALLARDSTDREGEYIFVRTPQADQRVYTRFSGSVETSYGHSHTCRASRSSTLFVDVT
jgi:hypothetical protein